MHPLFEVHRIVTPGLSQHIFSSGKTRRPSPDPPRRPSGAENATSDVSGRGAQNAGGAPVPRFNFPTSPPGSLYLRRRDELTKDVIVCSCYTFIFYMLLLCYDIDIYRLDKLYSLDCSSHCTTYSVRPNHTPLTITKTPHTTWSPPCPS